MKFLKTMFNTQVFKCNLFLHFISSRKILTYSIPIDMRETTTTIRSRMLKAFRQKEPLCRKAPYTVI